MLSPTERAELKGPSVMSRLTSLQGLLPSVTIICLLTSPEVDPPVGTRMIPPDDDYSSSSSSSSSSCRRGGGGGGDGDGDDPDGFGRSPNRRREKSRRK